MRKFDELRTALAVEYQVLPRRQGLRLALAGSSCSYERLDGTSNITGIFCWPSWNLSDPGQWVAHLEAMKHKRLFDPWGTWKGQLFDTLSNPRVASMSVCRHPITVRQKAATERRERLLQHVEGLIDEDAELLQCGHVALRKSLEGQGLQVTERDAKWLRASLMNSSNNRITRNCIHG